MYHRQRVVAAGALRLISYTNVALPLTCKWMRSFADDTFEAEVAYQREHFSAKLFPLWGDPFLSCEAVNYVRYWPKADMPKNAIDVAIGRKADMRLCTAYVCF
jgi:hypothetical protein